MNAACLDGPVPLHVALRDGKYKILPFLLAAGADIHARANNGRLKIWLHAQAQRRTIQSILVAAGALYLSIDVVHGFVDADDCNVTLK